MLASSKATTVARTPSVQSRLMPQSVHVPAMHASLRSSRLPPSPPLVPHVASRHIAYLPGARMMPRRNASLCMSGSAATAASPTEAFAASTALVSFASAAPQAFMCFSHPSQLMNKQLVLSFMRTLQGMQSRKVRGALR